MNGFSVEYADIIRFVFVYSSFLFHGDDEHVGRILAAASILVRRICLLTAASLFGPRLPGQLALSCSFKHILHLCSSPLREHLDLRTKAAATQLCRRWSNPWQLGYLAASAPRLHPYRRR